MPDSMEERSYCGIRAEILAFSCSIRAHTTALILTHQIRTIPPGASNSGTPSTQINICSIEQALNNIKDVLRALCAIHRNIDNHGFPDGQGINTSIEDAKKWESSVVEMALRQSDI